MQRWHNMRVQLDNGSIAMRQDASLRVDSEPMRQRTRRPMRVGVSSQLQHRRDWMPIVQRQVRARGASMQQQRQVNLLVAKLQLD